MKEYLIIENQLGFLCIERGRYTDKYGNVLKKMVFWSNLDDAYERAKRFNAFEVKLQYWLIKVLSRDLKIKIYKIPSKASNSEQVNTEKS